MAQPSEQHSQQEAQRSSTGEEHGWTDAAGAASQQAAEHYVTEPAKDLFELVGTYLKEKPDVAAVWCFGLGVIVGWKLKP